MFEGGFDVDSGKFAMELGDFRIRKVKKFERVWKVGTGGSVTSSTVLYNGVIYFGCADHFIYAINPGNGEPLWKYKTDGVIIEGSVYGKDGTIYIGSYDKNMYALKADDGKLVWKFRTNDKVCSTPVSDGGLLYFGSKDKNMYAVDIRTGGLVWKFRTYDDICSEALVWRDRLIFGSYDHYLYCLDKKSGQLIWKLETPAEIHNANGFSTKGNIIYFSCFDDYLRAVNMDTGTVLWKQRLGQYGCCTAPVLHGDVLYCTSRNGILYAVSTGGQMLWKFAARDNIGIPLIDGERIYAGSCDFNLYCIDLNGREVWRFKTNGFIWWKSAIVGNNVVFGSWDCLLYCIDRETRDVIWKFKTAGGPSPIPPANDAFQLELKVHDSEKKEEGGKTYQLSLAGEGEEDGAFYKSRITYQVSTQYREKGKYQTTDEDF